MAILLLLTSALATQADDFRSCLSWEVTVVDDKGKPVADASVIQEWGYSFFQVATNYFTNVVTDASGRVSLPERHATVAVNKSGFRKKMESMSGAPEDGPWASIYVWKRGFEGVRVHARSDAGVLFTASGMKSRVVLRPATEPR